MLGYFSFISIRDDNCCDDSEKTSLLVVDAERRNVLLEEVGNVLTLSADTAKDVVVNDVKDNTSIATIITVAIIITIVALVPFTFIVVILIVGRL